MSVLPYLQTIFSQSTKIVEQALLAAKIENGQKRSINEAGTGIIWQGDNLQSMARLAAAGVELDLIYLDPPYNSGANYFTSEKELAYKDSWQGGLAEYLEMMVPRLILCQKLLADSGVLALHVDSKTNSYLRLFLDEIFGADCFVNEIIWRYGKMANSSKRLAASHDTILIYSKSENHFFQAIPAGESEYRTRFERYLTDEKLLWGSVTTSRDQLIARRAKKIRFELGRELIDSDVLFDFSTEFKMQDDVFYDISIVKGNASEKVGFQTQKPVKLLERLITAWCPPDGLVADFFAGSGTTAVAADNLKRRWILAEQSEVSLTVLKKRLTESSGLMAETRLNIPEKP